MALWLLASCYGSLSCFLSPSPVILMTVFDVLKQPEPQTFNLQIRHLVLLYRGAIFGRISALSALLPGLTSFIRSGKYKRQ